MKKLIPLFMFVYADSEEDYNSQWTGEQIDNGVGIACSQSGVSFTTESNPTANIESGSVLSALFARIAGWISKLSNHLGDSTIHVTSTEKSTWNAKGSGTITGITMNGASKGTSGVVDLGTVITAHQDISGKAPNNHASSSNTYGVGDSSNYGHLKLSDSTSSTSGTSGGVAATPSSVKSAYDLANEKSKKVTYTGTLSTSSWSGSDSAGYTLTLTISGILATDTPVIGPVMTGTLSTDKAMLEAWSNVTRIKTAANKITCYAFSAKPSVNIPIQLMCMR